MPKDLFIKILGDIYNPTGDLYKKVYAIIGGEVFTLDQCIMNAVFWDGCTIKDGYSNLLEKRKEICDSLYDIAKAKNEDYSAGDDAYNNFYMCTKAGVSVEDGILVRMCDKVSRIKNLLAKGGDVGAVNESLKDTWGDLANYLTFRWMWLNKNTLTELINSPDKENLDYIFKIS